MNEPTKIVLAFAACMAALFISAAAGNPVLLFVLLAGISFVCSQVFE
jgi:hypothetical protein